MILRKPYAFLIRHFRLIHAILAALVIYLTYQTTLIYQFFSRYADLGRYEFVNNLASNYVNFFMYFAIILVLVITITVYFLMKSKDKKTKFYVGTIIYYIILLVMLTIVYGIFQKIQNEFVGIQTVRVYRDITLIFYAPQFFFIVYSIIRALGFNIKKFDFQKDLDDIKAEEKDREEVEIVAPKDTYKLERKVRRITREAIYYMKENTVIVTSIVAIIVVIIGTLIFFNREVYNKEYNLNQSFTYKSFNITALNTYLTNLDSKGTVLYEGKYYLVLELKATNNQKSTPLNIKHFRLIINGKYYYPTFNKNEHFIDLGKPYSGENIRRGDTKQYILIYEIPKEAVTKQYRLRVVDKVEVKIGSLTPSYKDLKLKPNIYDKINKKGTYSMNDEISFKGTNVGDTNLTIRSYEITNNYRYQYNYCYNDNCVPSYGSVMAENVGTITKTLLVLDYELILANTKYKQNILADRYFYNHFMKVRYIVDDKIKTVEVEDKTPPAFKTKYIAQINYDIKNATSIELIITVRNNQYIVKIK